MKVKQFSEKKRGSVYPFDQNRIPFFFLDFFIFYFYFVIIFPYMTVTENNNSHSSLEATRSLLTTQQSTETSRSSIDDKTLLNQGSIPRIRSSNRISFVGDENDTLRYANDKKNQDFHLLFKSIPEQDRLLEGEFNNNNNNNLISSFKDYGCALQKEILLQGRVYFTHHNICFNSNIFGWITSVINLWLITKYKA